MDLHTCPDPIIFDPKYKEIGIIQVVIIQCNKLTIFLNLQISELPSSLQE